MSRDKKSKAPRKVGRCPYCGNNLITLKNSCWCYECQQQIDMGDYEDDTNRLAHNRLKSNINN